MAKLARKRNLRSIGSTGQAKSKSERKQINLDEEIESSDDENLNQSEYTENSDDEKEEETAESKRRRMAKHYIQKLDGLDESDKDSGSDTEKGRFSHLSQKMRDDRLKSEGKLFQDLATTYSNYISSSMVESKLSGHSKTVTCIALSTDEKSLFSGSKDNSVIFWDTETNVKVQELKKKWSRKTSGSAQSGEGEVLSVATSTDGRYVVSGGRDRFIRVYDTRANCSEVHIFKGHRDAVTSLSFCRDSYSLFSGSLDRCIKHWDLKEMGYIETLFGHQDAVHGLDCWKKERPVSSSSDRTVRLWKVAEESHLIFRGHKASIDAVQKITEDSFISGGQDGTLQLWTDNVKTPLASVEAAHGSILKSGSRWITSLAAVKVSNLVASGSNDGYVRLWNVSASEKKISLIRSIPVAGFVNGLAVTPTLLVACTGNEHRLGRWWNEKEASNSINVIRFSAEP